MPTALPIDPLLPEVAAALARGNLVLEAPPGAGKTTRVPPALLEVVTGDILVAQPRRLAARLAARRVASERDEPLGATIGHQIRFDRVGGSTTRIWFVTEGVLVRRLASDPELHGVGAVLLDEFHERSLASDLALALLRRLQQRHRPELRIGVMSATLDGAPIAELLGAPRLRATGRLFPVAIDHLPHPDARPLEIQVRAALRRLLAEPGHAGDTLVFLPGAAEIARARSALDELADPRAAPARSGRSGADLDFEVVTLHGDQPAAEQDRAIASGPRKKIILSTNVAETSITIEGVTAVIDSGLARIASHSPWTGLPMLRLAPVSQASAIQRAGRAGRLGPGRCLRLYTQHDFDSRPAQTTPEILRGDLAAMILQLAAGGLTADQLDWLDPPPPAAIAAADGLLRRLGAIGQDGALTPLGRRMAELPLHPRLARLVVEGQRRGILADAALAAAILGERDLRVRRPGEQAAIAGPCDIGWAVDQLHARHPEQPIHRGVAATVRRVAQQIVRMAGSPAAPTRRSPAPADPTAALSRALLAGFPDRVARRRRPRSTPLPAGSNQSLGPRADYSRELVLSGGGSAQQADDSVVRDAELMVVVRADQRSNPSAPGPNQAGAERLGRTIARAVSAIEPEWLLEDHAEWLAEETEVVFIEDAERVEVVSRLRYDRLVLQETRRPPAAGEIDRAAEVLAEAAAARGIDQLCNADAMAEWRNRIALIAVHCPETGLTPPGDDQLRTALVAACRGKSSFAELRRAGLLATVRAQLLPAQRAALEELAPTHLLLHGASSPSAKRAGKRRVAVHYEAGKPPWIASRLQDFFGMTATPTIARGRIAVVLHLLAPNQRAVQITTDLTSFWKNHYPALRRQLQRRYPRHAWPDDPTVAQPPLRNQKPRR